MNPAARIDRAIRRGLGTWDASLSPDVAAMRATTRGFVLNGPTRDSLDVLPLDFGPPADAAAGDWIEVSRCGAYANALAISFNGFHPDTLVEIAAGEG